jgi:hypothetical protein
MFAYLAMVLLTKQLNKENSQNGKEGNQNKVKYIRNYCRR